jgi:hypothetical protein
VFNSSGERPAVTVDQEFQPPKPAKSVRYLCRDGTVDFLVPGGIKPATVNDRVSIGGKFYLVVAVIQYEDEFRVWVRREVFNVPGA